MPTIKYKESFCEHAIEYVGKGGRSIVQLAASLGVSKSTIYRWADEHEAFRDSLEIAKTMAEASWEGEFTDRYMVDRNINAHLVALYFHQRFRWHTKQQTEIEFKPPPTTIIIRGQEENEEI